jgi:hypothetical protein
MRTNYDVKNAHRHSELRLPHVSWSPSAVEEHVLWRPKVLRSFRYRSLGSTDEFPGAWALTKFLTILMKIHKLVQGSEGHRSENQTSILWNPYCPSGCIVGLFSDSAISPNLFHNPVVRLWILTAKSHLQSWLTSCEIQGQIDDAGTGFSTMFSGFPLQNNYSTIAP